MPDEPITDQPRAPQAGLDLNPRWVNYARLHGRSPDEQLAHDRKRWKGGSMCGFILWGRERIVEFGKAHPEAFMAGGLVDHDAYDRWLDALEPVQIEPDAMGADAMAEAMHGSAA